VQGGPEAIRNFEAALLKSLADHSRWIGWMKLDSRMDPPRDRPRRAEAQNRLLKL